MSNDFNYRPGLHKLIHHQEHLAKIERGEVVGPIHLSVFPNNFCQLDCPYCCFSNTVRNSAELSFEEFGLAIYTLKKYGLKAVELSGGGDPLLWSNFNAAVLYASSLNLKLSLITNGLALKDVPQEVLGKFTWIRPSVQSTKYAEGLAIDHIPSTVKKSLSFIVHNERGLREIGRLYKFAKEKDIIIRVAPKRFNTPEWEQTVEDEVNKYGKPLLFFRKEYGTPKGCYMLWIRAALDWNGYFLPCPSIELSPEYYGKIPRGFAVCSVADIERWLQANPPHDLGWRCSFCNCGKDTNDYIHNLMQEIENVEFV